MKKLHAIFGGNFDPIHHGHLYSAQNLAKEIAIEKIILLPNQNPPHRDISKTSIVDKIKMIQLAIHEYNLFKISYLETKKESFFYTIDTLKKIRTKIGYSRPLCLIIGEDHLQSFNLWKDWKKILLYSHLIVCPRNYKNKNKSLFLENWINSHIVQDYHLLHQKSCGLIFFSKIPGINVSSSRIRTNYAIGKSSYGLLPEIVNKYIILKKLYQNI